MADRIGEVVVEEVGLVEKASWTLTSLMRLAHFSAAVSRMRFLRSMKASSSSVLWQSESSLTLKASMSRRSVRRVLSKLSSCSLRSIALPRRLSSVCKSISSWLSVMVEELINSEKASFIRGSLNSFGGSRFLADSCHCAI